MGPGKLDLAGGRWVAFVQTMAFLGADLTDADFKVQVRQTPNASGAPLVDLVTVATSAMEGVRLHYAGTDTIQNHITEGRLSDVPKGKLASDDLALSVVSLRINETTMEGLPTASERGADAVLAWDMHVTPSDGEKQKWLGGKFIVQPGVTQ